MLGIWLTGLFEAVFFRVAKKLIYVNCVCLYISINYD